MRHKTNKILVIDDDPGIIKLLENVLARDGYTTIPAANGTAGIELARVENPDCILLDVLLPDIMGVEVAGRLQDDPLTADIPIVFMTVTIDLEKDKGKEKIEVHGHKYPAFAKPVHNRKLLAVIRKEINKRVHNNA